MEAGIDDVGLGVLFGLELYKYEFAGLLMHAEHLEAVHGVGPHTISVPRVKKADDIDPTEFDNGIDDETFAKITACHDHIYKRDSERKAEAFKARYQPGKRRFTYVRRRIH